MPLSRFLTIFEKGLCTFRMPISKKITITVTEVILIQLFSFTVVSKEKIKTKTRNTIGFCISFKSRLYSKQGSPIFLFFDSWSLVLYLHVPVKSSQALSGTLPTMINKTRGRGNLDEKRCKRCRSGAAEDDVHILASCKYNKDLITKHHDYVTKKIAKEILRNRPTAKIWRERSWRTGSEILRPDITMVDGDNCTIIDVTIPYERSEEYINQRRRQKVEKYEQLIKTQDGLRQVDCTSGQVIPVVIGVLGTITAATNQDLKPLKLSSIKDAFK